MASSVYLNLQLSTQVNLHFLFLNKDTRHDLTALVLLSLIFGLSSSWTVRIKFIPWLAYRSTRLSQFF